MASSEAMNPRVKEFADMMVKNHTAALRKLHTLQGGAANADVKPNAKHKQTAGELNSRKERSTVNTCEQG
jgi:predicted outer membrane protein